MLAYTSSSSHSERRRREKKILQHEICARSNIAHKAPTFVDAIFPFSSFPLRLPSSTNLSFFSLFSARNQRSEAGAFGGVNLGWGNKWDDGASCENLQFQEILLLLPRHSRAAGSWRNPLLHGWAKMSRRRTRKILYTRNLCIWMLNARDKSGALCCRVSCGVRSCFFPLFLPV